MRHKAKSVTGWSKGMLLLIALTVGSGVTAVNEQPAAAAAAASRDAQAVYNQFQKYIRIPSSLVQARNYLINHIDEAGSWYATVMTLQLENAQKAELERFSEKIYPEKVQNAIEASAANNGLTYTGLLRGIQDTQIRRLIQETWDKGYKLESSEGMYYPVLHYEGFKVFRPYVGKDISSYIDIMAAESNQPSEYDAGIVITWDELIGRTAVMSDFVQDYPKSNRTAAIRQELQYSAVKMFYGSDNTPAYDPQTQALDPELRRAYEDVLLEGPGNNGIFGILHKLMPLLDASGNILTPEVSEYLKEELAPYTEIYN
ncbi:hypothetical protein C2I18_24785 [Paenibacillus sp. PK3_47]|uniref:hypothetical protein n=1 Tax=Paenibacillus sp. PK3_47 TaxID=2072642 RepID=UPI00201D7AEE|nr:hypothetical protein [Paenibacillus sp. PK3_47]UQZ36469.1 hypothetical protein C2I18_24785 [Paenibacillus sp. PK3_47]